MLDLARDATALVKSRPRRDGKGSAFCIHPDGYFLSNVHVVGTAGDMYLALKAGTQSERIVRAKIIRTMRDADLALVRTSAPGPYPFLRLAVAGRLAVSSPVATVGYGVDYRSNESRNLPAQVNRGTVTVIREEDGQAHEIETDLSLNRGNSGGAILDDKGNVAAVVFAGKPGQGMTLGVPVNRVLEFIEPPELILEPVMADERKAQMPVEIRFQALFPGFPGPEKVSTELTLYSPGSSPRTLSLEKKATNTYAVSTILMPDSGAGTVLPLVVSDGGEPGVAIPFTLIVNPDGGKGARLDGSIPISSLTRGQLAHFTFSGEDGNQAMDVSGNNNRVILEGAPRRITGPVGPAMELDGRDDCLVQAGGPEIHQFSAISLALWIRTSQKGGAAERVSPAIARAEGSSGAETWGWLDREGRIGFQRGECSLRRVWSR
ncbi:MAG: serine protease [Kiritimatiellae bacterium]|nr:serine protease [Kiritimatiellia bacterium]